MLGPGGSGLPGMPQFGGGPTTPPPAPVTPGASPPQGVLFPTPTPGGLLGGSPGSQQATGPIVGVRSAVHKQALRDWRGQSYYDQWRFIVGDADRDTLPGGGVLPSAPQPTPFGRK